MAAATTRHMLRCLTRMSVSLEVDVSLKAEEDKAVINRPGPVVSGMPATAGPVGVGYA